MMIVCIDLACLMFLGLIVRGAEEKSYTQIDFLFHVFFAAEITMGVVENLNKS